MCSRVFDDKEALLAGALEMAGQIAARSPVAVQGTKINLVYSRDHSVAEGLHNMVTTLPLHFLSQAMWFEGNLSHLLHECVVK